MLTSLQWYIVTSLLAGLLALFAILAPRKWPIKCGALACTALLLPLVYFAINDLLGRPKPMHVEVIMQHLQNSVVSASLLRENEAIYLWLQMPGVKEPRAYQLPWDEQMAVELHKAQREAEAQGTEVEMQLPEGESEDSEKPIFQATKRIPPPPKET